MAAILELDRLTQAHQKAKARSGPLGNIPALPDVPRRRYFKPEFLELEREIMRATWLFGVHGSEIPLPGDYMRWDREGDPLVFARGEDGVVRCFFNICRHRANPVTTSQCGNARHFTCPVHGWTYDLKGKLVALRDRRDYASLDKQQRGLVEVRCEAIGQFHFINIDGRAQPLREFLGPIAEEWEIFAPNETVLLRRVSKIVKANYKIAQEANMEGTHVPQVHSQFSSDAFDYRATDIVHVGNGHSISTTPAGAADAATDSSVRADHAPVGAVFPEIESARELSRRVWVSFFLFPNTVIPFASWGYPVQSYWPLDENTTLAEVCWIGKAAPTAENQDAWEQSMTSFSGVLDQDFEHCEHAQKAVRSTGCRDLLMSSSEKAIYYHHEEMDLLIGRNRVPPELAVQQILHGL